MFNLEAQERKPLTETIPDDLLEKMKAIDTGRWSVEDVLEMQVDEEGVGETTTAASVGSGVPARLGVSRPNQAYEKLKKGYEEYLARSGKKDNKKSIREFVERTSPGNDRLIEGLTAYLTEAGMRSSWLTPKGKMIPVSVTHDSWVFHNLDKVGLTQDDIAGGQAVNAAIGKGWIRVVEMVGNELFVRATLDAKNLSLVQKAFRNHNFDRVRWDHVKEIGSSITKNYSIPFNQFLRASNPNQVRSPKSKVAQFR
jgi:hypothetical protein